MSRKAKAVEPIIIEPTPVPAPKFEEPKQPAPEPVRRNIFGKVIKPVVGGIGSGNAK